MTRLAALDPWPLLRSAPIALPQGLALIALVTLSAAEGGFPIEHWAPAAVLVALLLLVALAALPRRGEHGPELIPAIVLAVALAAWTALSISWADDRGAAAIATTRTALLVCTFILFARWRHRAPSALVLLTLLTTGLGTLAWVTVVRLASAADTDPWFLWERLLEPVGYVNAGAALWGVTAFLGVGLLGGATTPIARVIGALTVAPAAVLAILSQSRGGLLAAGIVVILLLVALPGRGRNGTAFAIAALSLLPAAGLLREIIDGTAVASDELGTLAVMIVAGACLTLIATIAWIALDARVPTGDPRRGRAARIGGRIVAGVGVLAVAAALAGVGPVTVNGASDALTQIKDGYEVNDSEGGRLTSGLGSGRWDFWTVAWDQFTDAPLVGQGADNYRQDYLQFGANPENPRYPHSLWLRQLGQLGVIGGLLMAGWLIAVAVAVRRLAAGRDAAGRALALAAGGAVGLWTVHGSVDWLLEFGGFSAIIAAIAGLAVAAAPPARARRLAQLSAAPRLRTAAAVLGGAALLLVAVWSSAQWLAERERANAIALSASDPQRATERAERARRYDPFGAEPSMLIGTLAISRGELDAARAAYVEAFDRNPRATAPRMWLGVLASAAGDQEQAARWLRRAARTSPRDPLLTELSKRVDAGEQLDPAAVRRALADRTLQLLRDAPAGG